MNMKKEAEKYGIPYEKHGRQLVWHDEFNEGKIDFDKWSFCQTMGGKDRVYDNSEKCCRIEGDKLLLQAHRNDDPEFPYRLSQGFTTVNRMIFKYGYVEMCACPPFRHGAWPSFWTQSATPFSECDWFSEIDIVEAFSSPNEFCSNIHKWRFKDGQRFHCSTDGDEYNQERVYRFKDYENLNNEFHVYGFLWDEEKMTFYVDDVPFKTFPIDPVKGNFKPDQVDGVQGFHDFMYLIINDELFTPKGGWVVPGWTITDEDEMPFNYYVDWVRVYQNPEKEQIKLKDEILAKAAENEKNK